LSLPWFIYFFATRPALWKKPSSLKLTFYSSIAVASIASVALTREFDQLLTPRKVLRDSTATVVAAGSDRQKYLLINGVSITTLASVTKMMSHLPLSFMTRRPSNALIICFGMGTSYRSALSWDIEVTAVELVPSVPTLFPFFYPAEPQGANSMR